MVLMTGYEQVKPIVNYILSVDVGETRLASWWEKDPSKILSAVRQLVSKGFKPEITARSEYHTKYHGMQREEDKITPEKLEDIVSGKLTFPSMTFPLLHEDIHGADIGD